MKRFFAGSIALAFAVVACNDVPTEPIALSPDGLAALGTTSLQTVYWEGHGKEHIDGCTAGFHWIAAPAGGIESRPLFYSNLDDGEQMFRPSDNNEPSNAAWHYNSGLVTTQEGVTPYITFNGDASKVKLIISHCRDDEEQERLVVSKTVDTSWEREHDWSIAKRVEAADTLEGTPKIWLFIDDPEEKTATWYVDVTYEGYEEEHNVSGVVTIVNTGDLSAVITDIEDVLGGTPIDLICPDVASFPHTLAVGATLVCTYDEDGFFEGENEVAVTTERDTYTDSEQIIWGVDPDPEVNRYATVTDTNDGFQAPYLEYLDGEDALDARDYNKGDVIPFSYSDTFTYGDDGFGEDECKDGVKIKNTAEVFGDDLEESLDSAKATLLVNIQCLVFQGETATGAGIEWRLTNRSPNNWFEFTPRSDILADGGADIITGRNKDVIGRITGENEGDTMELEFKLFGDWELADVSGAVKVHPMSCDTDQNYVQPGRFDHHFDSFEEAQEDNFPKADCYGIHLDVGKWIPDPDFGP